MRKLNQNLGAMEFDGLVTALSPAVRVDGGIFAKQAAATVLKRGTLLAKNSNVTLVDPADDVPLPKAGVSEGLLYVYDGTGVPDCILCDDTEVGTTEDVPVTVYVAGCFDPQKLITGGDYELTEQDRDILRMKGIALKAAHSA